MRDPQETVRRMREASDFIENNQTGLNMGKNLGRPLTQIEVATAVSAGMLAAKYVEIE